MRFDEAYTSWQDKRLTQEEAARLLGVCERTFRRYIDRYEDAGLEGLMDRCCIPRYFTEDFSKYLERWCSRFPELSTLVKERGQRSGQFEEVG